MEAVYSQPTSCFASKIQYRDKGAIQEISTVYLGNYVTTEAEGHGTKLNHVSSPVQEFHSP